MKNTLPLDVTNIKKQPHKVVFLQEGESEVVCSYDELLERFGVSGLIRIPEAELDSFENISGLLGHFNLVATNHQPGSVYLLVKIVRNGTYKTDTKEEKPPLLSLEDARKVECVIAENNLPLDSLKEEHFKYSLQSIADAASLKAILLKRYSASNEGLTETDIEAKGVAYTLLRVVEKVNDVREKP